MIERDSSPLTNLVRFRINDPYEIVYARACIVRTDEYLLGTKGSQLPSYVPCHAHYRLYNPSCDVTLFNPFITEPLRTLSFSLSLSSRHPPLAVLTLARKTEKRIKNALGCTIWGYEGAERIYRANYLDREGRKMRFRSEATSDGIKERKKKEGSRCLLPDETYSDVVVASDVNAVSGIR